ncbi:MAG TPA: hypothetical protein VGK00_09990 [Anaerolineales bacterium]
MKMDLLSASIKPADLEKTVRTYYCTYYKSRLLGIEAAGYLGITNKRVIFHAFGTSNSGSSVLQSEVPIADVSGISSYKGTYFSFTHLIIAALVSFVASVIANSILTLISGISSIQSGNFSSAMILGFITGFLALIASFLFTSTSIWKSVCATTSAVAFGIGGGGSLAASYTSFLFSSRDTGSAEGGAIFGFALAFFTGIYALGCMASYARRPTFSLAINSKGGSSTPINISGASGIGLFDVAAGKALAAEPAEDSEIMLNELGAVILDIQMLGDLGIDKWRSA